MKKLALILILFTMACSPLELGRLVGIGVRPFRQQGKTYSRIFDLDFFSCYARIRSALDEMGAEIYRGSRKKGFIVAYNFQGSFTACSDTTETAIFFTELKSAKTQVEVSSLNYSLAEFVASKLFNEPGVKQRLKQQK